MHITLQRIIDGKANASSYHPNNYNRSVDCYASVKKLLNGKKYWRSNYGLNTKNYTSYTCLHRNKTVCNSK